MNSFIRRMNILAKIKIMSFQHHNPIMKKIVKYYICCSFVALFCLLAVFDGRFPINTKKILVLITLAGMVVLFILGSAYKIEWRYGIISRFIGKKPSKY